MATDKAAADPIFVPDDINTLSAAHLTLHTTNKTSPFYLEPPYNESLAVLSDGRVIKTADQETGLLLSDIRNRARSFGFTLTTIHIATRQTIALLNRTLPASPNTGAGPTAVFTAPVHNPITLQITSSDWKIAAFIAFVVLCIFGASENSKDPLAFDTSKYHVGMRVRTMMLTLACDSPNTTQTVVNLTAAGKDTKQYENVCVGIKRQWGTIERISTAPSMLCFRPESVAKCYWMKDVTIDTEPFQGDESVYK